MEKKLVFFLAVCLLNNGLNWGFEISSPNRSDDISMETEAGYAVDEGTSEIPNGEDLSENEESETAGESEGDMVTGELKEDEKDLDVETPDEKQQEEAEKSDFQEEEQEPAEIEKKGTEAEETERLTIEDEKREDDIYHVSFPTVSRAYLDPDNLSGRGQIFSDEFKVENYGNTNVAIKIKNIEVSFSQKKEMYELSETEITDETPSIKKINVDVVWKNAKEKTETILNVVEGRADEYVLFLDASKYDEDGNFVRLEEGSNGYFYFTGTLNSNPDLVWKDGEMSVSFEYEMVRTKNTKLRM